MQKISTFAQKGSLTSRPSILLVTRFPPNAEGPGSSQRAMHILRALSQTGRVDVLMLYRPNDRDAAEGSLHEASRLAENVNGFEIPQWASPDRRWPKLPWKIAQILEGLLLRAAEAPSLNRKALKGVAHALSRSEYDLVFAFRLSSAVIAESLMKHGQLKCSLKICDLDDMLSTFKHRELLSKGRNEGLLRRILLSIAQRRVKVCEIFIARRWKTTLANPRDAMRLTHLARSPIKVLPNISNHSLLNTSSCVSDKVLFVAHLGYAPNIAGLFRFVMEIWPIVKEAFPSATFDVVGRFPTPEVADLIEQAPGALLHTDPRSVQPYYKSASVVVVPLWEGSGTRIKIIEAMALGRATVTTSIGADGLAVVSRRHVLIADTPSEFAEAVIETIKNVDLQRRLVKEAKALQEKLYSSSMIFRVIGECLQEALKTRIPSRSILP